MGFAASSKQKTSEDDSISVMSDSRLNAELDITELRCTEPDSPEIAYPGSNQEQTPYRGASTSSDSSLSITIIEEECAEVDNESLNSRETISGQRSFVSSFRVGYYASEFRRPSRAIKENKSCRIP